MTDTAFISGIEVGRVNLLGTGFKLMKTTKCIYDTYRRFSHLPFAGFQLTSKSSSSYEVDEELSNEAIEKVRSWRENHSLPFPRLDKGRMDKIEGTLDYPPKGSVELTKSETKKAEPLSKDDADATT